MTSRISKPNTEADKVLQQYLSAKQGTSFVMVAGAGSGKTTSLVKALHYVLQERSATFKKLGQKIACITYTEVAAQEIWNDVGNNPLAEVATIHSFFWTIIRPFQADIKAWVIKRIDEKIIELEGEAAAFSARVQQKTRDKNSTAQQKYNEQKGIISSVDTFTYGTGSDYVRGVLGHDDIIKIVPELIASKALLRSIIARKYPVIFVDESQDTLPEIVECLKAIQNSHATSFILGFFGDPMQKIYMAGAGSIVPGTGWQQVTKPENFRSSQSVLNVINAVRFPADGLCQKPGKSDTPNGMAKIFILPNGTQKDESVNMVRTWISQQNNDTAWQPDTNPDVVKILVIVHKMAASRLGFQNLFAAFNERPPAGMKEGFQEASHYTLRPFMNSILPIVQASKEQNQFDVISLLREYSPVFATSKMRGTNVGTLMARMKSSVDTIVKLFSENGTVLQVLEIVREAQLTELDERLLNFIDLVKKQTAGEAIESSDEFEAVARFFACPARELLGYRTYIDDESPFSTQHGTKGAEFERVLVVLDDDEGTYNLYSYNKYFGITPLSDRDNENIAQGNDSVIERTRRLFYVCCSRALRDLAVVFFVDDVQTARAAVEAQNIFSAENIHTLEEITV